MGVNKQLFDWLTSRGIAGAFEKHLPPVEQWQPQFCGKINIRIAANGDWYHEGTKIQRKELVKLFSSILRRVGNDFFLVTPVEKMQIQVDDAPFTAVGFKAIGEGDQQQLFFVTNVDDVVCLDASHRLQMTVDPLTQAPRPYIHIRNNLQALISRAVFYQLVDIATEMHRDGKREIGVMSSGEWFSLGELPN